MNQHIILILSALVIFGNNYAFDNPQALQDQIIDQLELTVFNYNMLYSIFSLPNIFLTVMGGIYIDKIGGGKGVMIFSTIVTIAQFIVALGGVFKSFHIMLFGRALFGLASEQLIIAQNVIITSWFKGHQLSKATGIITTLPEISSALNSFFTPLIYEQTQSIAYPLFTSVCVCLFSLICAALLMFFDKLRGTHDLSVYQEEKQPTLEEIRLLPITFWYLVLICTLTLGIYTPFMDDISDYYQKKYHFNAVLAGKLIVIPYLVSASSSFFVGRYIDKIGNRRFFLMITCLLFILAQLMFGSLDEGNSTNPNWQSIMPLIIQGFAFTFYSCVTIPAIQYIVDQKFMGTAFGILGMMESLVLFVFPLIAGKIVDLADTVSMGYKNMSLFYAIIGLIALLLCISLYHYDQSTKLDFIDPNNPLPDELLKSTEYSMVTKDEI
ncbi:hypothetical protein pb186bvf_008768 [Paramecium bursaria]